MKSSRSVNKNSDSISLSPWLPGGFMEKWIGFFATMYPEFTANNPTAVKLAGACVLNTAAKAYITTPVLRPCNMFLALVGEPHTGKSTLLKAVESVLTGGIGTWLEIIHSGTPEAIAEEIQDKRYGIVIWDEAGSILQNVKRESYLSELPYLFNSIYQLSRISMKRRQAKSITLRANSYYVSVMFGALPEQWSELEEVFGAGFERRILPVSIKGELPYFKCNGVDYSAAAKYMIEVQRMLNALRDYLIVVDLKLDSRFDSLLKDLELPREKKACIADYTQFILASIAIDNIVSRIVNDSMRNAVNDIIRVKLTLTEDTLRHIADSTIPLNTNHLTHSPYPADDNTQYPNNILSTTITIKPNMGDLSSEMTINSDKEPCFKNPDEQNCSIAMENRISCHPFGMTPMTGDFVRNSNSETFKALKTLKASHNESGSKSETNVQLLASSRTSELDDRDDSFIKGLVTYLRGEVQLEYKNVVISEFIDSLTYRVLVRSIISTVRDEVRTNYFMLSYEISKYAKRTVELLSRKPVLTKREWWRLVASKLKSREVNEVIETLKGLGICNVVLYKGKTYVVKPDLKCCLNCKKLLRCDKASLSGYCEKFEP